MSENQSPIPGQPVDPNGAFSNPVPPPPGAGMGAGGAMPPRPSTPVPPPMPPMQPMPPMMYPMMAPPPPRRHGFVRGILVTLATTIFGFSLMLNLYLILASGFLSGGESSRTTTIVKGEADQLIALVPIDGIITDAEYDRFNRYMNRMEEDGSAKALIIEINTPGGSVNASDRIYNRVQRFKKKHEKTPVIVSMGALATSGGYYSACAGDYIVAQRTTLTGNIGVLMPNYNVSDLVKKLGVSDTTIVSSGTPFKDAGSMMKPENPASRQYLQDIIDQAFGQFKSVVVEGREGKLKKKIDEIANGKVYTAEDALKLGLIDQVGYLEDAIAYASQTAGLTKPEVVRYHDNPSLRDLFVGAEGKSTLPAGGLTVHVSPEMIDRLTTPRLMYVWRGE